MSVIQVNTPNLTTDLLDIANAKVAIENNADTKLLDIIPFCFQLKPSNDCDTLRLYDFTDYSKVPDINYDNLTIEVSFGYKKECECEMIGCSQIMKPNGVITFEHLDKDGIYGVFVNISYIREEPIPGPPGSVELVTYTDILQFSYEKDCCSNKYKELNNTIKSDMANKACSEIKLSKIGRSVKQLKKSYVKLSNLNWLYINSKDACNEVEKVNCLYKKIK